MVMELFPLSVKAAATRRHGKILVGPVDLDLDGQGTCVVIGPNGAGKTTLLRLLHGIARLHSGEITWGCETETAYNAQAFVFQRPVMLRRSVVENRRVGGFWPHLLLLVAWGISTIGLHMCCPAENNKSSPSRGL